MSLFAYVIICVCHYFHMSLFPYVIISVCHYFVCLYLHISLFVYVIISVCHYFCMSLYVHSLHFRMSRPTEICHLATQRTYSDIFGHIRPLRGGPHASLQYLCMSYVIIFGMSLQEDDPSNDDICFSQMDKTKIRDNPVFNWAPSRIVGVVV